MSKYILLIGFVSIFFSGCISVTKELPPYKTYTLAIENSFNKEDKHTGYSLAILEPKALASVNNILITYKDDNYRSETYALSKWDEKPSKMLHQAMISSFDKSGSFSFVHGNKINIPADIKLISELDSFTQYLESNSAYVDVSIRVFMIENKNLYTKTFRYKQKCDDQSAKSSVEAFNRVNKQFLDELYTWVIGNLNG